MTLLQRRLNVDATSWRCIDVEPMLYKCYVPAGVPASVAQLDVHPTGDQEVAGFGPRQVSNILLWRLIMKYFLWSLSPFCWSKKGSCQFLVEEYAQYWLTA